MVALYLDGSPVSRSTNCSIKMEQNMIDATVKEDAGWFNALPGLRTATLTVEAAVWYQNTGFEYSDFIARIIGRNQLGWVMRTSVSGDIFISGGGYVSSADSSYPVEAQSNWSGEITVIGSITVGNV